MAFPDYGTSVGIPQPSHGFQGPVPGGSPSPMPDVTPPKAAAPQMTSQPTGPTEEPKFNEDELVKILSARQDPTKNVTGTPDQYSGVDAQGSPWQIAQASIGRNVNERLQIWSKMVGDKNATIGPDNDIWIKGKDSVFHPADHGHTNFLQDFAAKTGAGIDLTAQAFTEIASAGAGFAVAGPPGAAVGTAVGLAAGPAAGSYGRQFLESRVYGVTPDKEQIKRDALIGGGLNLLMGGVFSGMGLANPIAKKMSEKAVESPANRAIKIARAQEAASQFMDVVGATPAKFGEEGIEAPMQQSGQRVYSAVDLKRQQLNDQISVAKDQIIAASDAKPDLTGLAVRMQDFLKKNGMRFDDKGMPIPFETVPLGAEAVNRATSGVDPSGIPKYLNVFPSELPVGSVNEATLRSPLGAEGGTGVLNDMSEDYKAMVSGQMDMKDFLNKIQQWQDKSDFRMFDTRSTKIRSAWAQLQHQATQVRNGEIENRLASDPEMLSAVKNAYGEYSSSKDAIDMVMNTFGDKGAYEAGAKNLFDSKNESVLSGLKTLMADQPQVFKDLRGSWLSEKMSKYVNYEGLFDSNSFFKDLKGESRSQMKILFTPEELGKIQRSAKVMGTIKTSDLMSPEQGQAVSESIADLAKSGAKFDITKPGTILDALKKNPKMADYVADKGLPALAKNATAEEASAINNVARTIKNWVVSDRMVNAKSRLEAMANLPFAPNLRGTLQMIGRNSPAGPGIVGAASNAVGYHPSFSMVPPTQPKGETGSEAGALNELAP